MRNRVKITLRNGEVYYAAGYTSKVAPVINEARGSGKLIELERDAIPTGQKFFLDPDQVASVRDDR